MEITFLFIILTEQNTIKNRSKFKLLNILKNKI